jgi:hypothetical protein
MTDHGVNRREFIKLATGGLLSAGLAKISLGQTTTQKTIPVSQPVRRQTTFPGKSLVVEVASKRVICFDGFNRGILQEMIVNGLNELVGVTSFPQALNELFSKKDIIGFKFNSSHAGLLRTNIPLAEELLRLLVRHGFDPQRIFFIEVQPQDAQLPPTAKVKFGWGREVDFGSGKDRLIAALDQVTALVNVGQLKANAIAGMSGCLKNMAYGVIKHPARYHANHCTPYIADIYNQPAIRDRVRVNILNALRVLVKTEQFDSRAVVDYRRLLFSRDVVAVDSVGFERLDEIRKTEELPTLVSGTDFPRQLIAAYQKGLGIYHPDQIFLKKVDIR